MKGDNITDKMKGKVVIITGGGSGIGFGIATAYAKEGANIIVTGRTVSKLENAKAKLEKEYGVKVLAIPADGGIEEDVKNVINKTVEEYGKIDIVINNAQAAKAAIRNLFM